MPAYASRNAGTGGGVFEQGKEVGLAIVWEGEDLLHYVDRPAEDDLLHAPGGVAFAELLKGYWFLPCNVVLVVRSEEECERDVASSDVSLLDLLMLYQ